MTRAGDRLLRTKAVAVVRAVVCMAWFRLLSRLGRRSLLSSSGPVVSLTSYGPRLALVHLAIESIGRGRVRPRRLILWLDDARAVDRPPRALARLAARGLEIRGCPDFGPHKKYFPYALSVWAHTCPLVTADDDVLYPASWLQLLVEAADAHPEAILAHRVDRAVVDDGNIAPYASWGRAHDATPSPRNFAVGVKGVLYPPGAIDELREAGDAFSEQAPKSADVWFNLVALRARRPVLPVEGLPLSAIVPMRSRLLGESLMDANVIQGRNDRLRALLLTPRELQAVIDDDYGCLG